VVINGITTTRSALAFEAEIPLTLGQNQLALTATSPNGHVTTMTLSVVLGTIPTITSMQPADGTKLYAETTITIQATATDAQNDPMVCQILLDEAVVVDWFTGASHPWTPTTSNLGLHSMEVRAKDDYGGEASIQAEVYVLREPVPPP
jgi:hypothetical protein